MESKEYISSRLNLYFSLCTRNNCAVPAKSYNDASKVDVVILWGGDGDMRCGSSSSTAAEPADEESAGKGDPANRCEWLKIELNSQIATISSNHGSS
jgi:hypothetical protein